MCLFSFVFYSVISSDFRYKVMEKFIDVHILWVVIGEKEKDMIFIWK
jgi:hypothetical protein